MKTRTTIRAFVWAEALPQSAYDEMFPPRRSTAHRRRLRERRADSKPVRKT